jgi:uncharacterized pyridoxamine 5'-phosphate oxidase family protein
MGKMSNEVTGHQRVNMALSHEEVRGGMHVADGTWEEWPREDLGNDRETWKWALDQFGDHTVVPLATLSVDGPRVRPVTVVTHEGKVYALTGSRDAKMEHLRDDPRFEFYLLLEEGGKKGYVRFMGRVMMVEDLDLRKEVGDASGFAWSYFNGPEDPEYALLEMNIRRAEIMPPGKKGYRMLSR